MMAAIALSVELLHFQPESARATVFFKALAKSNGDVNVTNSYRGDSQLLMLWGPGAPSRRSAMKAQLAKGGHVICWDLAYWDRHQKHRVSIDAAHPQAWVMKRDWSADRLRADGIAIRNHSKMDGPIIVAGIGRKAKEQYGDEVSKWEASMIQACRERWPHRTVLYRRKRGDMPVPSGVRVAPDNPIERALQGASLVVTWHSNVAVDAIRMNIPVVCRDGAAAAVCPSTLPDEPQPLDRSVAERFLGNLAWFQWSSTEAKEFWPWLYELLA